MIMILMIFIVSIIGRNNKDLDKSNENFVINTINITKEDKINICSSPIIIRILFNTNNFCIIAY